jgi:hypothetical protein
MRRRHAALALPLLLATIALRPARGAEASRRDPAERERQLDAWWTRQREKEAADRFWNGPRERRRDLTRDQIEQWERQRERRRGWTPYPF